MSFSNEFLDALQTNIKLTNTIFVENHLPKLLSCPLTVSDNLPFVQAYGNICTSYPYYYEVTGLNSYCLIYTESGAATMIYNCCSYSLVPNTLVIINCLDNYSIEISQAPWNYMVFFIKGHSLSFLYNTLTADSQNLYHFSTGSDIPSLIRKFYNQLDQCPDEYFLHARMINDILLDLIIEKTKKEEYNYVPDYLIEIKQIFDSNYCENFSLDSLEQQYHINKYRLCREFTQQFGTSPILYLNSKRVEVATDLLRHSDKRINEIGRLIGFENTNHFIRLFKKRTGVTPLIYRKQRQLNKHI